VLLDQVAHRSEWIAMQVDHPIPPHEHDLDSRADDQGRLSPPVGQFAEAGGAWDGDDQQVIRFDLLYRDDLAQRAAQDWMLTTSTLLDQRTPLALGADGRRDRIAAGV
jgi:hypothetical protein